MQVEDIRAYKKEQRKKYRGLRKAMSPEEKERYDREICRKVMQTPEYQAASTILAYVSLDIEVDTLRLIEQMLKEGKRVAAPRCIDGTCEMEYYVITSLEQLSPRTYGVLEPDAERCPKLTDFQNSLCLVPGLAFDHQGFRLGYGKGYYDRFLCRYSWPKIGMVYENCVTPKLHHGRFDVSVDLIVTEEQLRRTR